MFRFLLPVLSLAVLASSARAATGGTPLTIAQSGYLLDALDQPITANVNMTFRVFTDPATGTLEWEGTCAGVQVRAGYYAVELGGAGCVGTGGAGDSILSSSDLPATGARWLEVQLDTVALTPRLSVTSPLAGFDAAAVSAITAAGLPWANVTGKPTTFAPAAHTHAVAELSAGTNGQILTTSGGTAVWQNPPASGVSSVNGRAGAVTLSASDVTTALGYTPASGGGSSGSALGLGEAGLLSLGLAAVSPGVAPEQGGAQVADPFDYVFPAGVQDVTSSASSGVFTGTAQGPSLTNLRDGNLSSYGVYFAGGGGTAGMQWLTNQPIAKARFFNFNTNARIANFRIEAWNGSAWAKVPITGWVEGCGANNTDEATAFNTEGWVTVTFAQLDGKSGIRFVVDTVWVNGNSNAGIAEMQFLTPEPASGLSSLTGGIATGGYLTGTESFVDVTSSATALSIAGTASGFSLSGLRDGVLSTYGGYFAGTPGSGGFTWSSNQPFRRLRFFNFNTNARIAGFKVEAFDGSAWAKVPITTWVEGCSPANGDEAIANNTEGWVSVAFGPLTGRSGLRLAATSVHNNGNANAGVAEMQAYTSTATPNFTAVSVAYPASFAPASVTVVVEHQDVSGTVVLNTDVVLDVSRDGGTTWSAVPLVDFGPARTSGVRALIGTVAVSSQPAGTSMKWRARTFNAKDQRLHGVWLHWQG